MKLASVLLFLLPLFELALAPKGGEPKKGGFKIINKFRRHSPESHQSKDTSDQGAVGGVDVKKFDNQKMYRVEKPESHQSKDTLDQGAVGGAYENPNSDDGEVYEEIEQPESHQSKDTLDQGAVGGANKNPKSDDAELYARVVRVEPPRVPDEVDELLPQINNDTKSTFILNLLEMKSKEIRDMDNFANAIVQACNFVHETAVQLKQGFPNDVPMFVVCLKRIARRCKVEVVDDTYQDLNQLLFEMREKFRPSLTITNKALDLINKLLPFYESESKISPDDIFNTCFENTFITNNVFVKFRNRMDAVSKLGTFWTCIYDELESAKLHPNAPYLAKSIILTSLMEQEGNELIGRDVKLNLRQLLHLREQITIYKLYHNLHRRVFHILEWHGLRVETENFEVPDWINADSIYINTDSIRFGGGRPSADNVNSRLNLKCTPLLTILSQLSDKVNHLDSDQLSKVYAQSIKQMVSREALSCIYAEANLLLDDYDKDQKLYFDKLETDLLSNVIHEMLRSYQRRIKESENRK